jgi:hypothetical protein
MQAQLFCGGAEFRTAILLVIRSLAAPIEARVIHVDIESRSDVLNGKTFGSAGAYEQLTGAQDSWTSSSGGAGFYATIALL